MGKLGMERIGVMDNKVNYEITEDASYALMANQWKPQKQWYYDVLNAETENWSWMFWNPVFKLEFVIGHHMDCSTIIGTGTGRYRH